MDTVDEYIERHFILKNMISKSCIRLIELYFNTVEFVHIKKIFLGEVILSYAPGKISEADIIKHFTQLGFTVVSDPDIVITEKIKVAAIELIHFANNTNSLIRNSDYISERVQLPYDRISKVFSKVTNTTLEKYIILLKIEKAKEMITNNEFSLSEIAFTLGYSSVQYLSNQFKKTTGYTVSQYKEQPKQDRVPLENLI
ncbi:MAG: AraC family transcriptional regulator [Bacteroidota bacterium]|nr:AraC family transcriptional regulator [Bacteroidota bacterium]